jgi:excisionase family DNA binding protein
MTTTTVNPTKLLFSRAEVCQLLSISLSTLDRLIARKALKPRYVGDRPLFRRTELERFAGVKA